MFTQTPETTCVEELTLVVVSREDTSVAEPYRGHAPENDACHVFAQDPSESPFLFDLRLRECLQTPSLLRSLARAVLVCAPELNDRELLRRLRLVAARVRSGGCVTLAYHPEDRERKGVHFADRLRNIASFAGQALQEGGVAVDVLPVSQLAEESAPLSAVWHRLQRQRGRQAHTAAPAANESPASAKNRRITRTLVCQQRRVTSARVSWPDATVAAVSSPFPALPARR